jgi:hypothetical protein
MIAPCWEREPPTDKSLFGSFSSEKERKKDSSFSGKKEAKRLLFVRLRRAGFAGEWRGLFCEVFFG